MTVYRTCKGCADEGRPCEFRNFVREKIKGMGVTTIKWKCAKRVPRFTPGEPIFAMMTVGEGPDGAYSAEFPGIFVSEGAPKALVYIAVGVLCRDDRKIAFEPRSNGYCKIALGRIAKRDGERDKICKYCGNATSSGHTQGFACNPGY